MGEEVMIGDNSSLDDGPALSNSVINETENPDVDYSEDDDINNRLTVSRSVSDSVTRGMVNAVETEGADKIAQTEIEPSRLKEALLLCLVGSEGNETSQSCLILGEACKEEYEQRLLEQTAESCGDRSLLLEKKTKEIAGLRRELELISKLLTGHENGDVEVLEDQKRSDLLHRKISGSLGKHIGSVMSKPENTEDLRQLSREQLINHYKSEMNQLKREHDYTMQEMTEEYFSIKRRFLNLEVCGTFSSLKKDKEFDALRKKIPDIISKLDNVLMEDVKPVFAGKNDAETKRQLDSLLIENRRLKDSLSEYDQKMSQLTQVEANHRKLIRKLESDVEASVYEDVYGSFVGDFVNKIQCAKEEANLEHSIRRESCELISRDLVNREEASESKIDLEDSCVESYMAEEKERLKEEIYWLDCLVKDKENLVQIAENDLATEREKLEMVSHQINNLQFQIDQQAVLIQDKNKELNVVSARALEKTEGYEMEISELRQNIELVRKEMKITENEKLKYELKLSSTQAEQKKLQNQFLSTVLTRFLSTVQSFDNLECLVAEETKKTNSRLKSMQSQINDLSDEVDELKVRESMYKQQMDKKTCDLLKAEAEVDLLGDEIESHLDLLEKIYIALDHYSLILKHYPGIIEILKLVRRELRRDSKRLSVF